jgi:hypothetical protein
VNDHHIKRIMRERFHKGRRTMSRDDWEVVIAEILGVFALIMWARVFIVYFTGANL